MQVVLLIGIQASGKSTFFRQRFADTHVRINLDMLGTRHREARLFETCLEVSQPCVIDNTNPARADRQRYLEPARTAGAEVLGFYFSSSIEVSLARNAGRPEGTRVPERGVRGTHARLELPRLDEGFDALCYVTSDGAGGFQVQEWRDEV